jgi:hypothetical protein
MNSPQRQLHSLLVLLCTLLAQVQTAHAVSPPPSSPIAVTGFNRDVVTDANTSVRFADSVDIGTAAWFESGAVDNGGTAHQDGLTAGFLTSAFTNSVSGGHTVFQFQPFSSNNALLMQYPSSNSGTLAFTAPSRYQTLSLLSAGYNAASNGVGTVVINFTDGSHSQPLNYIASDWGFGTTNIAIDGRGRNFDRGSDGKAFNYNQPVPFKLYETDLDLNALGLSALPISGLTFTGGTVSDQPGAANHGPFTTIFAVSGTSVPEPNALTLLLIIAALCATTNSQRHRRRARRLQLAAMVPTISNIRVAGSGTDAPDSPAPAPGPPLPKFARQTP